MNRHLVLVAAITAAVSGQTCDYYSNNRCIKPEASASATIPFTPLFPTPPTYVYAVDQLDENDVKIQSEKSRFSIPSDYKGAVLKVAWWLEYDNKTVNFDKQQNRHYYAFAMETNSTNPVGGDANGCANLLGSDCVRNLKDVVAVRTFTASYILGGLGSVMDQLYDRPLRNLSCPEDIFGAKGSYAEAQMPLYLPGFNEFATITEDGRNRAPLPPGNASFTHGGPQLRFRTLDQQKARGIVAVTVSWPAVDAIVGKPLNYTMDDVRVEMACLRLGGVSGGSGGNGNTGGASGGNGQSTASRPWMSGGLAVPVAVAALVQVLL